MCLCIARIWNPHQIWHIANIRNLKRIPSLSFSLFYRWHDDETCLFIKHANAIVILQNEHSIEFGIVWFGFGSGLVPTNFWSFSFPATHLRSPICCCRYILFSIPLHFVKCIAKAFNNDKHSLPIIIIMNLQFLFWNILQCFLRVNIIDERFRSLSLSLFLSRKFSLCHCVSFIFYRRLRN